ncbi:tripartite tricarboxylate transporter TctB family protein [Microvirga pudoricolor]|uniref:tripartite tricarboxylate transporter TctB family protein n=1 Tax=Microvirga pudoricolor TaxID=2778729 RepID=UPI00194FF25B|nr:tripartite tricarboxylate transporter TctB family protein [Microvirga pudoricolor]MBM6594629.1 tripartite tricarboxylate transporter TctB family protein [Microvirga pudoricolor]
MESPSSRRPDVAGLAIAFILLALAGLIWWDLSRLQLNAVYGVGPKAMPMVVAAGLGILAIGNAIAAFRGDLPERESLQWQPIILIIGGLAVMMGFIHFGVGFILATTVLFAATAAAFGRRAFLVDLAIGFVLGLIIYVVFSKLLALSLPMGPIERLL